MLEIKSRRIKTTVILELSGTIDIDSANLIERVGQALTDGYRDILCDFESVTSVDYSGLSALAIAFKNTVNHKGRMKFYGVPAHIMAPRSAWKDTAGYDAKYAELARLFVDNFKKFGISDRKIAEAGPRLPA